MAHNKLENQSFADLYFKYLRAICSDEEARELLKILEEPTNDHLIKTAAFKAWNEIPDNGKTDDSMNEILNDLHHRININERERIKQQFLNKRLIKFLYRAAAVLFIPLILYSAYLTFKVTGRHNNNSDHAIIQTIKVPSGVRTDFVLPDGSHIWLNSGSVFKCPGSFQGKLREVELTGEAYFDIARDKDHPFIVRAGKLNVEVTGTKLDVINYPDDPQIEVILESGQVILFSGQYDEKKSVALMEAGERAIYNKSKNSTSINKVDADKYTLWKNGILIFRDDPMSEVIRKLSHKFNVDIELQSPDIDQYVYTATFINESLIQILELLRISAPLSYSIIDQKKLDDNTYSRSKIIITKIQN